MHCGLTQTLGLKNYEHSIGHQHFDFGARPEYLLNLICVDRGEARRAINLRPPIVAADRNPNTTSHSSVRYSQESWSISNPSAKAGNQEWMAFFAST